MVIFSTLTFSQLTIQRGAIYLEQYLSERSSGTAAGPVPAPDADGHGPLAAAVRRHSGPVPGADVPAPPAGAGHPACISITA